MPAEDVLLSAPNVPQIHREASASVVTDSSQFQQV